jgi:cyclomaltodextrinase / maltogenic alpha-amylase / neopullulanase
VAIRAAAGDAEVLVLLNAGDDAFRFPVDVTGFTVTETPDPGARPADPALVPAHSWVTLGS